MRTFLQDLRYGLRMLAAHPGFTAVAVLSLAVGIGANTAMFSLADAILLRPFPVERPGEDVCASSAPREEITPAICLIRTLSTSGTRPEASPASRQFGQVLLGFRASPATPAQVKLGAVVTTDFFDVLGVRPALGRAFRTDEDQQPVAVLSHALWQSQFAGDPSVIGRQIRLSNLDFTVIGVAPASFPGRAALRPRRSVSAHGHVVSACLDDEKNPSSAATTGTLLCTGGSRRVARPATRRRNSRPSRATSSKPTRTPTAAAASRCCRRSKPASAMTPTLVPLVALLLSIAGLVLMIACANVASLLLSRARARSREIAIRLAIGAGRARLLRQFLTESLLLAILGGAAGLVMAMACMQFLSSIRMPTAVSHQPGRSARCAGAGVSAPSPPWSAA